MALNSCSFGSSNLKLCLTMSNVINYKISASVISVYSSELEAVELLDLGAVYPADGYWWCYVKLGFKDEFENSWMNSSCFPSFKVFQ